VLHFKLLALRNDGKALQRYSVTVQN